MTTSSDDGDDLPAGSPAPEEPPVMPTAAEAAAAERGGDERPAPVRYAFVVWVLAGVAGVVNSIGMLLNKQQLIDTGIQNKPPNVSNEQIERSATTLLWLLLIAAVAFAALFALFAYKAQNGVRRARLLLTMLCIVTVAYYFLIVGTVPGILVALLSLAATVMLYLPSSNTFFAPRDLPT